VIDEEDDDGGTSDRVGERNEFRPTLVKQGASIGANATVLCGITLGRYCMIGAGAVVTKDVPDFALVTGVPALLIGWVSRRGLRLHFESGKAVCAESGETYLLNNGICDLVQNM
jgi:UDP-2-acetamido-3-amino-2,3-dideoxy-glucuronate N-acetyltransferase